MVIATITGLGYWQRWAWTGLVDLQEKPQTKYVWDWLQLLIIPIVLGSEGQEQVELISVDSRLPAIDATPTLGSPFWLKLGQTAFIESDALQETFLDVISDSGCPVDVQCVWAGEAVISINITKNAQDLGNYELMLYSGWMSLRNSPSCSPHCRPTMIAEPKTEMTGGNVNESARIYCRGLTLHDEWALPWRVLIYGITRFSLLFKSG